MVPHSPFLPLLLITLLAVAIPILASRIQRMRLPIVVGEILAGIIIGQSGFNLVPSSPTLAFLAEFGFAFLMFLSGLEIDFGTLFAAVEAGQEPQRPRWQHPLALAGLCFGATLLLAFVVGLGLSQLGLTRQPILLGLILSTTSLGIVVPVLKEYHLTTTLYGQVVLATALLSDFVTLLLLSIVIAAFSHGLSLDLLLFLVLLVAFVVAAKLGQWASRLPVLTRLIDELSHATAQIRVRGCLALLVIWIFLFYALGVEVILGAFLAGAVVSLSAQGQTSPLPEKLDAIGYGFFVPLFFIMVGATFDLRALLASPTALLLAPLLIAAAYIVKVVPAFFYRTLFAWRETLAAGVLLSSRLSLIIAASAIALQLEVITAATNAAIILVAIVTCTLSPIFFARLLPRPSQETRQGVLILGTGPLAELLGGRLRRDGEMVTLMLVGSLASLQQSRQWLEGRQGRSAPEISS
jgi:Kef-type K+ transport system membrane component KefB